MPTRDVVVVGASAGGVEALAADVAGADEAGAETALRAAGGHRARPEVTGT